MLEKIFDPIFAPFRALRSFIFGIQNAPNAIKGDIARARNEAGYIGSEVKGYGASAQKVAGAAGNVKPPAQVPKKMNLFGKKSACESCGQKLHPSWDECPYCGWKKGQPAGAPAAAAGGAAPAAAPASSGGGSPQRTMALDLNATGGATGVLGWLIPLEGARVGELIELRGRVTVGKSADNQVAIEDGSISGHHCEFVGSPNGFKINDLGSTNGTFVNDKRITSHDLIDNDNVKLGKVRFKFKSLN